MSEDLRKHLEFIQANITRMNQCSIQMKGWAITIVSALLAVYAATINDCGVGKNIIIYIAIAPTVLFWILDAYYLQQERKFRAVYNDVAKISEKSIEIKPYAMPLSEYKHGKYCLFKVIFSKTEWPLYSVIIVSLIVAGLFL